MNDKQRGRLQAAEGMLTEIDKAVKEIFDELYRESVKDPMDKVLEYQLENLYKARAELDLIRRHLNDAREV